MALIPAVPPGDVIERAANQVQLLIGSGDHFLGNVPREKVELAAPHRVYVLPFGAIGHNDLSRATFVGWQFLVVAEDDIIGTAEALNDQGGSVAVSAGPFAKATAQVIDRVETLPDVGEDDFELRILRINALYIVAAWLAGKQSMVIPLEPSPKFILAGKTYSERGFLEALRESGVRPFRAGAETS